MNKYKKNNFRKITINESLTDRDSKSIKHYLYELRKMPLITHDEESKLFGRFKLGDEAARQEIIHANLRFVVAIAKQYHFRGTSMCDLINEGNVGLIKAMSRYDVTRGFKFISYAVSWVRQSILEYLHETYVFIAIPRSQLKKQSCVIQDIEQLFGEQANGMLFENPLLLPQLISMDDSLTGDQRGTDSFHDILSDGNAPAADHAMVVCESLRKDIARVINRHCKNERTKEIVRLRFGFVDGLSWTLESIGMKFNVTMERIRQVVDDQFIANVRKDPRSMETLRTYLGQVSLQN